MNNSIRVGTRKSPLAEWQAQTVINLLAQQGHHAEIVFIKSEGDLNLTTPLYELGIQGIFTKSLDIALLENRIDIAVHSYKDVPTLMAEGLIATAVLERGNPFDVLVCKNREALIDLQNDAPLTIATSSIRRKAQWLHAHNHSRIENIRGNVNSRLQKLKDSSWHGAIFAAAGLERLGFTEGETGPHVQLHSMLPAPAQGAIVLVGRKNDSATIDTCVNLNHIPTQICTQAERDFLRLLHGGCSTPISAYATISGNEINFKGNITSPDGSESISVELKSSATNFADIARDAAEQIISKGGKDLLKK